MKALFLAILAIPFFLSAADAQYKPLFLIKEKYEPDQAIVDQVKLKVETNKGIDLSADGATFSATYEFTVTPSPDNPEEVMVGFPIQEVVLMRGTAISRSPMLRYETGRRDALTFFKRTMHSFTEHSETEDGDKDFNAHLKRFFNTATREPAIIDAAKNNKLKALYAKLMQANENDPTVRAVAFARAELQELKDYDEDVDGYCSWLYNLCMHIRVYGFGNSAQDATSKKND